MSLDDLASARKLMAKTYSARLDKIPERGSSVILSGS